jgi:L-iditol 2-dehydrogenase
MKQLVCRKTGSVEIDDIAVPVAGRGELLVRMSACGICGTDLMKVYDATVAKPVQLGHEIVGTVLDIGVGVAGFQIGQRVAVAHHAGDPASHYTRRGSETQDPQFKLSNVVPGGFAEIIRVPADLVPRTVHAIPDHVPDMRAVFMEPLACCLRALERVPMQAGDTVVVVGVGAIGLLFLPLLRNLGAQVVAVDVRDVRLSTARKWGAVEALRAGDTAIAHRVKQVSDGRGADVVILTTTNPQTLVLALDAVRDGGIIIPFGVKPGPEMAFDFWQIYRREISVVTSYSATPVGLKEAMRLLSGKGFEFEKMISHQFAIDDAAHGFALLHDAKASKVVITG